MEFLAAARTSEQERTDGSTGKPEKEQRDPADQRRSRRVKCRPPIGNAFDRTERPALTDGRFGLPVVRPVGGPLDEHDFVRRQVVVPARDEINAERENGHREQPSQPYSKDAKWEQHVNASCGKTTCEPAEEP